jgi:hypothetical protein|tara:strand:+ start:28 stop:315 length:288 start_codon:yes stop_codon:yes gene_type:complete
MAGQEVRAYNVSVAGFGAGLVGPSRARLQGVLVNAAAACTFTIRSGSATGEVILSLSLPVGWNDVYIPNDGILADNGCFVHTFTGTGNVMTLIIE